MTPSFWDYCMKKKTGRPKMFEEGSINVGIRMPKSMVTRLDELVLEARKLRPMQNITRSDFLREMICKGIDGGQP